MKRAFHRLVSRILIQALVASSIPLEASAAPSAPAPAPAPAQAASPAQAPPPVLVNRSVPVVAPPPLRPTFSWWPSAAEITRARIFEEPLVPAQDTSRRENRELAQALTRYLDATSREDVSALDGFLAAHPASPWRTSLLTNLGLVAQQTGYFTKALQHYEEAWRLGKDATEPRTRAIAQRAASELAWLLTGLGHDERLAELLKELEGRPFSGSSDERVRMARQGLWLMQNRPEEAFRCGPVALSNLLLALGHANSEEIAHTPGSARGTSLTQMKKLAATHGVGLRMARRQDPGAAFPAPAMIHLKTGHFAALLERSGDRYKIADPVFRQEHWVSAAALDAEASGYLLVPDLPQGFQPIDDAEGDEVWGRSCPNGPDPTQTCPAQGGSNCAKGGICKAMADYTFLSLHAALRVVDTPLQYSPAKGPALNLTLTYNQKEIFQPAVFSYVNVGPKWTFDAVSYVIDDPSVPTTAHTVKVYLRGGGMEIYPSLPVSAVSDPEFRTRATLQRISANEYRRSLPDGSYETFSRPDGGASFPRKLFLTEEVDAQGNKLSFVYSDSLQLSAIVDALGQVTSFTYADEESRTITRITDPFGRTAILTYDVQGRLSAITDSLGLTSSFTYGDGDLITALTTPYGTTHFSAGNDGRRIWVEAEDPLGGRERAEYVSNHDSTIGPRVLPPSEIPAGFESVNGNFDAALTLFWGKRAMALAPNDLASAVMTHWLEQPGTHLPRGVARAVKKPLEGRVFYAYPGQFTSHGADGRLRKTGRILSAGSPQSAQVTEYTTNLRGRTCTLTDPLGRVTRYTYGTQNVEETDCPNGSGIDLMKVEQQNGSSYDLVQRMNYNEHHQPLTVQDAAGQTTTYTYNAAGQLMTITTPPRAGFPADEERTTVYAYDAMGYLSSTVSPGSVIISYTYDAYGRTRTRTDNDGDTTTYDYDTFDRLTRTTHPDGTYDETVYDRLEAHRFRDRLGRWTEVFHDALRRVVSHHDAAGRVVRQEWCPCGSLDRRIDASGNPTTWEYDLQGRVTREIRANGAFKQYVYEPTTSRLARKIDAKNQETQYTYDRDDRLTNTTYVNAQHPTPNVSLSFRDPVTNALDPHGRVRSMTDGIGVTTYYYVGFGQLGASRLQSVDGPYGGDDITYGYDEWGREVGRTFEGLTSTWRYDLQARLEKLTDPIGEFRYTYHGNTDRVHTVTYPNQQTSVYSYHDQGQDRMLSQLQHRRPDGANLHTSSYTYDDLGNIKTWTQQVDSNPAERYTLEYDRADQLVAATLAGLDSETPPKRYRYAYDPAGNRTADQVDDTITGALYDSVNRLSGQSPGGSLAFRGTVNEPSTVTVAGQPASVTAANEFAGQATVPPGTSPVVVQARDSSNNVRTNTYQVTAAGATRSFSHDANGNLASRTESGVTTTYDWDAEDRLITVRRGATILAAYTYDGRGRRATRVGAPESATYVWDGDEVIEERSSLFPNRRYVRGASIDRHLAMVENNTPTYFLADHLGSVVRTTNSASATVLTRQYDPWGNLRLGASTSGYAYSGREWEASTGLYYFRARYYDPSVGRFLSEDPVASPQLYAYARNNPIGRIDPLGTSCFSATLTKVTKCDVKVLSATDAGGGGCPMGATWKGGSRICDALMAATPKDPITIGRDCPSGEECTKKKDFKDTNTQTQELEFTVFKRPKGKDWEIKGDPPPGSDLCRFKVIGTITGTMTGYVGTCEKPAKC